jgi:hypothetical protein
MWNNYYDLKQFSLAQIAFHVTQRECVGADFVTAESALAH